MSFFLVFVYSCPCKDIKIKFRVLCNIYKHVSIYQNICLARIRSNDFSLKFKQLHSHVHNCRSIIAHPTNCKTLLKTSFNGMSDNGSIVCCKQPNSSSLRGQVDKQIAKGLRRTGTRNGAYC